MLRKFALFPFLFILFVILNPLINNLGRVSPIFVTRPLVLMLLIAAGMIVLLALLFRNWHYAAYLTFLVYFLFFTYGHINDVLLKVLPEKHAETYSMLLLAVMLVLVILLGLRRTWNRFGGASRVSPLLNIIFVSALLSQVIFGWKEVKRWLPSLSASAREATSVPDTVEDLQLDCSNTPDIYWIILDGYGRQDVLDKVYGVDTSPFLDFLKSKGFYVADQSYSNYIQTVYSIPSAMNFSYLEPMPAKVSGYHYFPELIARNRIMALLEQCGYQKIATESGFYFTSYTEADTYLSSGMGLNEFEDLLLASTPLDQVFKILHLQPPKRSYEAHRERVLFSFKSLSELPDQPGPKFVYAHIITPHPPFVFDAEGSPIQPPRGYSMSDGNDYRGSWQEYRKGYTGQVQNADRLLEQAISDILSKSKTPPIIVIQGDHGPGGHLQWKSVNRSCLWERVAILNAYYLPPGGNELLYPEISPVNTFRVILNTYFGTDLELLPDRTYFTNPVQGKDFFDITEERSSDKNCWQGGARPEASAVNHP